MPAKSKAEMTTRRQDKARQDRADAKARKACVAAVWLRAESRCEWVDGPIRCFQPVNLWASRAFWMTLGHVDEIVPKSRGGSPHDPENCRLLCHAHHFSGASGAHRHTPNWRDGVV